LQGWWREIAGWTHSAEGVVVFLQRGYDTQTPLGVWDVHETPTTLPWFVENDQRLVIDKSASANLHIFIKLR